MKRITIKDIAKLLQINISTVSRALNNHPDISDQLKAKVKETAEILNYHPSDFAVNFRQNSSKVIGLIIPEITMFFMPSIIKGISKTLSDSGYRFFILSSEESLRKEIENIKLCANSRVDGILISFTKNSKDASHLKIAEDLEIPIVIFDKSIDQQKFDEVLFDNAMTAKKCAHFFIKKDCKNILAIFGNKNLEITQDREKAFVTELSKNKDIKITICNADSSMIAQEQIESEIKNKTFDGFFAMSDEILVGLNIALVNNNIGPNSVEIIAISEGFLPRYLNHHYRYIQSDGREMGIKAAEVLLDRIKNKDTEMRKKYYL